MTAQTNDSFPQSDRQFAVAGISGPRPKQTLKGLAYGALIGGVTWTVQGAAFGAGMVLLIVASAKVFTSRGYMPYHATLWGDVWFLAFWLAAIFGALGLFAGGVIGARVGRRADPGEPSVPTIFKWTWNAFGMVLATLATKGKHPVAQNIPREPMEALRDDMEVTIGWTAWGIVFLLIAAFLSIPTSWPVLAQLREARGIEGVVVKTQPSHNTLDLDVKYTAPSGEESKGSFQRDGNPLPAIKVGDKVRLHSHVHFGDREMQVVLPGEQPDSMHSPEWERLYAGVLGGLLILPFSLFFFNRAVRRP